MHARSLARAVPLALLLAAAASAAPRPAEAFCGFYVGGAGQKLFNNATMVVLMREGTRTVLSMQNNYQGPADRFAMVVPVPVVLQKDNVKTLPRGVFDHIDQLAAPRLVEYWEQDPCAPPVRPEMMPRAAPPTAVGAAAPAGASHGVKVEAEYTVGEYEVVILSASDALGLDTWLRENKYAIPDGAAEALKPYVAQGMKFFVAKVDPSKVTFADGMAMLSPLRFHYDAESFSLPVRLGLLNSGGTQDLIVHILGRDRYEAASKKNVTIPTNLEVDEKARAQFPALYAALFDATLEQNPGAVITEYAWSAASCDPCPTPPLEPGEFATLGGDALPGGRGNVYGYTLTRLHLRYRKEALADDLVLRTASGIMGGREVWKEGGKLEHGAEASGTSNFQGRYVIRHPWKGSLDCVYPKRGVWGGPPAAEAGQGKTQAAQGLAFAPRGKVELASWVREDVPELKLLTRIAAQQPGGSTVPRPGPVAPPVGTSPAGTPPVGTPATSGANPEAAKGCGGCATGGEGMARGSLLLALGALALGWRRRRGR
jgi:MYXO-CTERM domain-containing protein